MPIKAELVYNDYGFSPEPVTFEDNDVYDQADAGGFIKINALRLRLLKARDQKAGKNG